MAKRHKHYSGKKKSKNGNNTGAQKKVSHKAKHRRNNLGGTNGKHTVNHNNVWHNSSVPMGDDDLMFGLDEPSTDIHRGRAYISPETIEDYYFGRDTMKNDHSLKFAGLRKYNKRQDPNNDSTANLNSFRKREMVFVKAKEAYDPSHDMIEKLRAKESNKRLGKDVTTENDAFVDKGDSNDENISVDIEFENDFSSENEEGDVDVKVDVEDNTVPHHPRSNSLSSSTSIISDRDLFFVDESGDNDHVPNTARTVYTNDEDSHEPCTKGHLEFNPSIVIGKVELDLKQDESNPQNIVVESRPRAHPFSGYINSVMKNMQNESDFESDEFSELENEIDIVYEPSDDEDYLNDLHNAISDSLSTQDEHEEEEEVLLKETLLSESSSNDLRESIKSLNLSEDESKKTAEPEDSNKDDDTPAEPEFGFLEEDFVINTSEVRVSNIRLGLNENSYYVESYRLFGDYDSRWLEQELFNDYITNDLGLPEHRLSAYLSYVKDLLIPKEETPEPIFSDIAFSDTSEENFDESEDDDDIPDDMMEGLDDLVSYSLKYNDTRNQEFETHALQTIGKGKKKRFLVNEDMQLDGETISTLNEKLQKRISQKAKKRRTKEDFIAEENKNSRDLLKKYPYGLHVQNIKDELESFLIHSSDSLSFPPLDPHGNKTVAKFANHYNMKTKKSGRGNKQHIIIQKVKKTKWSTPNYNLISQLLKQRPVFMRVDVSRVSETHVEGRVIRERVTAKARFNIKEGELVGKDAPEIGRDNIGRRLLEKLGWSSGEGLGALGNKGINEPVLAVVKKNKTGLGHRPLESGEEDEKNRRSSRRHGHKRHHRH